MSSAMIVALGAEVVILVVVVAVVMSGAVMAAWTLAGNLDYRTKCTWRHSRPSWKAPNSRSNDNGTHDLELPLSHAIAPCNGVCFNNTHHHTLSLLHRSHMYAIAAAVRQGQ